MRRGIEARHRHARHRFDAGADEDVARIHLDRARCHVDRLHRRAAKTVDRRSRHTDRQVGKEADDARNVEALLSFGEGAAHDEVFDVLRVDAGALHQFAHDLARNLVRADLGELAFLGEVEGGADIARDNNILHDFVAPSRLQGRQQIFSLAH